MTIIRDSWLSEIALYQTAVYIKDDAQIISQPLRCNYNNVEMMLLKANQPVSNLHMVGIYCSFSKVEITRFIDTLEHLHSTVLNDLNVCVRPVISVSPFDSI